jgi:hypothetical protein
MPRKRLSYNFGTDIRTSLDTRMLAEGLKGAEIDPRYWVAEGTVCKLLTDTGELDYGANDAVWNDSGGVHVDVELQPIGVHVTCRYAGIQAGDVTIFAPIRPGNIVKVSFPDGDFSSGVIDAILHSRSQRQPTEEGKPLFDNNRLLIYANSVPIDIRTKGGVKIGLTQGGEVKVEASSVQVNATNVTITSGSIKLGGEDASQQLLMANLYRAAEVLKDGAWAAFFTAFATYIGTPQPSGIMDKADPGGTATPTMLAAAAAMAAAIVTFEGGAPTYLSPTVKNK